MQILNESTNVSIEITALDALMNLAGELVLGRNPLMQAISADDMGIINLRSKIVTVIDTEKILGLTPIRISDDMRTIIVNTDEGPVGLMVDRIGNVVAVDPGEIDSPTANIDDVPGRCFDAVFKTDDQLVGLLSLQSIC